MEKNFESNFNKPEKEMKPISELIIEEMARIVEDMNEEEARERIGSDNYDRVQEYKNKEKPEEKSDDNKSEFEKMREEDEEDKKMNYYSGWKEKYGKK